MSPRFLEAVNLNFSFISDYLSSDPTPVGKGDHYRHEWMDSLMISKAKSSGMTERALKNIILC